MEVNLNDFFFLQKESEIEKNVILRTGTLIFFNQNFDLFVSKCYIQLNIDQKKEKGGGP